MRIVFVINTPAQLHLYKNVIRELENHGHKTQILLRDYGETTILADKLGFRYEKYSSSSRSKIDTAAKIPLNMLRAFQLLGSFRPDLVIGNGIMELYPSALLRIPCIIFSDGEPQTSRATALQVAMMMPLAKAFLTPESYLQDLGSKHIRMPSFKELAYLHPNRFTPRSDIYAVLDLKEGTPYVLLRFNAFDAMHDVGISSLDLEAKRALISKLKPYARVFISSEKPLPDELKEYTLKAPKDRIHDVLFYANLVVTETGTMTTESAMLGTPAIMIYPTADLFGNWVELEERYGLIFTYKAAGPAIEKAVELISRPNLKEEWKVKQEELLKHKVDATHYIVTLIERYPEWSRHPLKTMNLAHELGV